MSQAFMNPKVTIQMVIIGIFHYFASPSVNSLRLLQFHWGQATKGSMGAPVFTGNAWLFFGEFATWWPNTSPTPKRVESICGFLGKDLVFHIRAFHVAFQNFKGAAPKPFVILVLFDDKVWQKSSIVFLSMGTSLWILFLGIVTYCVNIIPRLLDMSRHQPFEASEVNYSETYPPIRYYYSLKLFRTYYSGNLHTPSE